MKYVTNTFQLITSLSRSRNDVSRKLILTNVILTTLKAYS